MKHPQIIIAHPGEQHARRAVVGLQSADMLMQYVTSFYYKKTRLLNYFPVQFKRRLEKELCRRRNDKIDDSLVEMIMPFHELFLILAKRSGFPVGFTQYLMRWRNHKFDRLIAEKISQTQPNGVIVYNSSALQTLLGCRNNGVVGILDQTIGHPATWKRTLKQELSLHPDLYKEATHLLPCKQLIDENTAEALGAEWVLAGSEYTKRTLIDVGVAPERIKIIPYGADLEHFWPADSEKISRQGKFKVLFVGSIGLRKGVHYLLEAIRQLNHPQIELHLVGGIEGSGQWLSKYDGIFKHTPFVTHDKLCHIYRNSDVFVFPSLHEGFGMVLNEAIASGLPIIGTPCTGVPDILKYGKCGYVIPIRDVEQLKKYIIDLFEDNSLYEEMSNNARKVAELFSWDKYEERLTNWIKAVV